MRTRHLRFAAIALIVPLLLIAATAPAPAIFGGLEGFSTQVEQWVQIAEQVVLLAETVEGFDDQLDEMRNKALGQIGALVEPFEQLASRPTTLFDSTLAGWIEDFEGSPRELADTLTALGEDGQTLTEHWRIAFADADAVDEQDILALFPDRPDLRNRTAEAWRLGREAADRRRIADYAAFDAAEELLEMLTAAQESVAGLRGQTNLADTALQQAALSGQLTDTEINVALAQLMAHSIIRDGLEEQQRQVEELQNLERWAASEQAWRNRFGRVRQATLRRAADYRTSMLLPEHHGQ